MPKKMGSLALTYGKPLIDLLALLNGWAESQKDDLYIAEVRFGLGGEEWPDVVIRYDEDYGEPVLKIGGNA